MSRHLGVHSGCTIWEFTLDAPSVAKDRACRRTPCIRTVRLLERFMDPLSGPGASSVKRHQHRQPHQARPRANCEVAACSLRPARPQSAQARWHAPRAHSPSASSGKGCGVTSWPPPRPSSARHLDGLAAAAGASVCPGRPPCPVLPGERTVRQCRHGSLRPGRRQAAP